jgi:integrase
MASSNLGHIEQLPSGSFRVLVSGGTDPITGRRLRHRKTVKTEEQARIVLGRLLESASAGQRPDTRVTVGELIARYLEVAELDLSTRQTYEGYIRRTILPALGSMELGKVRGPVLDTFYIRLRRCGDLACNGRPFTEHVSFPPLVVVPGRRPAWQQVADTIKDAVRSGQLSPGEQIPSAREMADWSGLRLGTMHHALAVLVDEGVIDVHQGRRAVVSGDPEAALPRVRRRAGQHDCARSGCRQHQCKPMSPATVKQIHAILSGAFGTAVRWEWIERNPASSAKLPKARPRTPSSPTPDAVAKVIATARDLELELLALYLWLAAVTGARRGELCGLQWADLDLDAGIVHVAFSYLVLPGVKVRKDTKTHQDRYLAIDEITVTVLKERWQFVTQELDRVGVELPPSAFIFSHDPIGTAPWDPNWVTKKVSEVAAAAGITMNVKSLRHYSASQLLAGGIDLRNTAARLGHGGGGATTLRHYADPVSEVDRRAAAYLARLTAPSPATD